MRNFSATDAKNQFGQLMQAAQSEPVRIVKNGRDVAVVLSAEEYQRLIEAAGSQVNPAVAELHAKSVKRWGRVYEALAK